MRLKILYVDMDGVLVDFQTGVDRLSKETRAEYQDRLDEVPGVFALPDPMPGAVEAYEKLASIYDTYILSTAPWSNPSAWTDKLLWVKRHFETSAYKRLILSHHKNLNVGDYLIDDDITHGATEFCGEYIHFGADRFPDWESVVAYLTKGRDTEGPWLQDRK